MKSADWEKYSLDQRRPSPEGRGLKLENPSLSVTDSGRPSPEGRGLKYIGQQAICANQGRPSPEGRGLKFTLPVYLDRHHLSSLT